MSDGISSPIILKRKTVRLLITQQNEENVRGLSSDSTGTSLLGDGSKSRVAANEWHEWPIGLQREKSIRFPSRIHQRASTWRSPELDPTNQASQPIG